MRPLRTFSQCYKKRLPWKQWPLQTIQLQFLLYSFKSHGCIKIHCHQLADERVIDNESHPFVVNHHLNPGQTALFLHLTDWDIRVATYYPPKLFKLVSATNMKVDIRNCLFMFSIISYVVNLSLTSQ